jgi:CRISPR system Cascade subunit CasE
MYLSKLILNERDRKVRADLGNAHNMHRSIMQAFPDEQREKSRADWNILFRQEPDSNVILVQSDAEVEPDWSQLPQGYLVRAADVKPFNLQANHIKSRQTFQFRLKANPSKRDHQTRKIIGLYKQIDQLAWLEKQASQHGFVLHGVDTILTPNIFGLKNKGSSPIKIQSVLFQGILQVSDPILFIEAIHAGIGRGRSYGCGLLSIAKVSG